jgi:hypothetical protein
MGQRGFTRQELQDIFKLDLDRPQDRPAIAALQASRSRQCIDVRPSGRYRRLRDVAMKTLRKQRRRAE